MNLYIYIYIEHVIKNSIQIETKSHELYVISNIHHDKNTTLNVQITLSKHKLKHLQMKLMNSNKCISEVKNISNIYCDKQFMRVGSNNFKDI